MENTTKAILIGVGLFITIALISAVLVIMGVGNNLITNSSDNLNGIFGQLEKTLTEQFDDKTVTGAQVTSCIKEYYSSTKLTITLNNVASGANTIGVVPASVAKANTTGQVGFRAIPTTTLSNGSFTVATNTYASATKLTASNRLQTTWLSDSSSGLYVRAQSEYHANLIRANGEVVGVAFTKAN